MYGHYLTITIIATLALYAIGGCIWGFAVKKIVENKGYSENWFWWGFFFGLLALLVALTKPECHSRSYSSRESDDYSPLHSAAASTYSQKNGGGGWLCDHCGKTNGSSVAICSCGQPRSSYVRPTVKGEWVCSQCGRNNALYVGTCACGMSKNS